MGEEGDDHSHHGRDAEAENDEPGGGEDTLRVRIVPPGASTSRNSPGCNG